MSSLYSYNLSSHWGFCDDFMNSSGGDLTWDVATAGTNLSFASYGESGHPGIARYQFGTANASNINLRYTNSGLSFGYGQVECHTLCRLPFTGTSGTYNYTIGIGFLNGTFNAANSNGVFFTYDNTGFANNLATVTVNNGQNTITKTSTVVNTGSWYLLSIVVNANASKADFYINKVLTASHTTNIPNGVNAGIAPTLSTIRTSGVTNDGILDVDMFIFDMKLTTGTSLL